MHHYNINVIGKVQGVYFRASTLQKAKQLGVKGYVQNKTDGSVYIEAEAQDDVLKEFVAWCNVGPLMAKVQTVQVKESKLQGFQGFEVR